MKSLLIALILFSSLASADLLFRQKVRVKSGFYKGSVGTVVDYFPANHFSSTPDVDTYAIDLSIDREGGPMDVRENFAEKELEKVK